MTARPTTPIERDPARLADALPWYRNGTLSDDDRAWVEARLDEDPAARDAALFDDRIAAELEARLAATPADIGWQQLLARARADDVQRRATAGGSASGGGREAPMSRLAGFFGRWLTPQLGMAMAALLVVQAVAIGVLVGERGGGDTVEYRSGADVKPVPMIRALLNESATEAAVRGALLANRAVIVDGPNALGEYWILPAAGTVEAAERAAAALRDAGVVASFAIDSRPMAR